MNLSRRVLFPEYDSIVRVTQELVLSGTFAQSSLGEIAYRAGISETTLRVFFQSKEEIILACGASGALD